MKIAFQVPLLHTCTGCTVRALHIVCVILLFIGNASFLLVRCVEDCKNLNEVRKQNGQVEVYWINLNASVIRRQYMERQLQYYGFTRNYRITAATPRDLLLPTRLAYPELCNFLADATVDEFAKSRDIENIIRATSVTNNVDRYADVDGDSMASDYSKGFTTRLRHHNSASEYTALISDHCGRKKNTLRELTVTVSHLKALYFASRSGTAGKYALILEDDVLFPHALQINELIKAAPPDFAMIQFVTTNERHLQLQWQHYTRTGELWTLRGDSDLWCASAYLINKEKVKRLIDSIVIDIGNKTYRHRITAGYSRPCFPAQCCESSDPSSVLTPRGHCVHAARGYQADNFIFALVPAQTYISNVPIVTGGRVGFNSTIHQEHVHSHHTASFKRVNGYVSEMETKMVKPPSFLDMECRFDG
jgi:GR25 family glycosyltransferase involved in LPS biosynthesis